MGRRPNPIVQEYFHRGQKLSDASNRYVHTCKRCGVIFPKGRVDSLMSHLLRRCPSITQEDRHLIHDATQQQNPDLHRIRDHRRPDTKSELLLQEQQQQQHRHRDHRGHQQTTQQQQHRLNSFALQHHDVELPLLLQRKQSALDTLAEASQQLANDPSPDPLVIPASAGEIEEQNLIAQLQGNSTVPFLPSSSSGTGSTCLRGHLESETGDDSRSHHHLEPAASTTDIPTSPLIQAASAANQHLGHVAQTESRDVLDPVLMADIGVQLRAGQDDNNADNMLWNPGSTPDAESFAALTGTMHSTDPDMDQQMLKEKSKHKRRGQFSDSRRKEVQEIRKRGACIRCRMLKKPCSEGTPCSTCKNVESARLWKSSCLRTRLADAFVLWSSGLYHSKAKIEVLASVHDLAQDVPSPGRLEVQLFRQSDLCMTFAVRKYAKKSLGLDAGSTPQTLDNAHSATDSDVVLLSEGEGMTSKIEEYANQVTTACVIAEPSLFLQNTLKTAQTLIESEALADDTASPGAPRSCYNLHNQQLLKNVVELWVETTILASRKQLDISLRFDPIQQPRQRSDLGEPTNPTLAASERNVISVQNKSLIVAQLLAAIESRCFALSKSIMNEIERRLLQRQQVSRFSTFISAVILLNCIERMTGVYRSFDKTSSMSVQLPEVNDTDPHYPFLGPHESNCHPLGWPLQNSPRKHWSQGEQFADLLVMLLRMRALPPRTTVTSDGKLVVDQEQLQLLAVRKRLTNEQSEEQTTASAIWLDSMRLDVESLVAKRDSAFPEHDEDIRAWDLKFISNVLLPESFGLKR